MSNRIRSQQAQGHIHTVDSIVKCLEDVVTSRKPTLVRCIEFFSHSNKVGQMGNQGASTVEFLEKLSHNITGAKLASLRVEDWPPLWVLRDLRRNIPSELTLAEKIITQWKKKDERGEVWSMEELCQFIQEFWNGVCSCQAAVGGKVKADGQPDGGQKDISLY